MSYLSFLLAIVKDDVKATYSHDHKRLRDAFNIMGLDREAVVVMQRENKKRVKIGVITYSIIEQTH